MSAGQEGSAPLAGIEYRCRAGQAQDSFVLVIRPDARAMLEVQGPTGVRRASAWLDPAVLRRLVGALRAGGFPALRQAPGQAQPGTPTRVLSVTGFDQPGQIELPWHDADAVGYGAVFRILDSMAAQLGGPGLVRNLLPQVVHHLTVDDERREEGSAMGVFGAVADRPVYARTEAAGVRVQARDGDDTLWSFTLPSGKIGALVLARAGDRDVLAVGTLDGSLRAWDLASGDVLHDRPAHTRGGYAVAATTVGDRGGVATGGPDGVIRLWDCDADRVVGVLTGHTGAVRALTFGSTDGRSVLVSGGDDATVRVWDPAAAEVLHELTGHEGWVETVTCGHVQGRDVVVSAGSDAVVRVWDLGGGELIHELEGHGGTVRALALTTVHGHGALVSAGLDATIRFWDPVAGKQIRELSCPHWVIGLALGEMDGRQILAAASSDGYVPLWDLATGELVRTLAAHQGGVTAVAFLDTADGVRLASAGADRTVKFWDPRSGQRLRVYTDLGGVVTSLAGLEGLDLVVSADETGAVRAWRREQGESIALTPHVGAVRAVVPVRVLDVDALASTGADGMLRFWRAGDGAPLDATRAHAGGGHILAVGSLDGRDLVASAGGDRTVRIWNPHPLEPLYALTGHATDIDQLAFGRLEDGRVVLASASGDGTIHVWDPRTGQPVTTLRGPAGRVTVLVFGQVGQHTALVSGTDQRELHLWHPSSGNLVETVPVDDVPLAVGFGEGEQQELFVLTEKGVAAL
ncbi:hypothetical protein C3Y87_05325 [Carbonactinospora thermoautotrophica]|uniref:WD40 repeat domain-containing protein n=1 Tax=Carbonactinospora thermoautotrophica TaxID=1469144 RepID=UPI0022709A53|nr:WD40 repeat domain-containing protein [Carbonactinospora thermoautotrophica]MCX9190841.1 hypothetical protein [Carbonactinospora thermoautotrophica]